MLFKKIIALYSENYSKPKSSLRGKIAELLNVNVGGTYSYR
jgi:hypothetical protein